jgi:hypothetical protein
MDLQKELQLILDQIKEKNPLSSELGFFSKPSRIKGSDGNEYMVKLYRPLKTRSKAEAILQQHNDYVEVLRKTGIIVPPTSIAIKEKNNRFTIVIIQPAYEEKYLVRGMMETCSEIEFLYLLQQLLKETITFWKNKPNVDIGFHPTLRNYAFNNDHLEYFDTFPPMLMRQKELNKLIIYMAPAKINMRALVPNNAVNRVSNEYYQKDKMIIGIIGSSCRLRPEFIENILICSREYISQSPDLKDDEKHHLIEQLKTPPRLSGIWVTFRKVFGKTGKPNVK